jgi:MoaA/NifB/PqqE/SkfB family radical SAM enzyme
MSIILKGSAKYLELKGQIGKGVIEYLMLNFPFLCNYKCLKCCNRLESRHDNSSYLYLSLDEIKNVLKEARDIGARVLVIAGEGEPLLHSDILKIVSFSYDLGLIPYIFTNGSMLNKKNLIFLRDHGASLIISLDSLEEKMYEKLVGIPGAFKRVMKNIAMCREIYSNPIEKCDKYTVVRIAINTVATQSNIYEIEKVKRFCGEDIIFVCNLPFNAGSARYNWNYLYGSDPSNIAIDKVVERMSFENGPLGTTCDGKWCAYMRHGLSIGTKGEILTCAYALETEGLYGNVRDYSLDYFIEKVRNSLDTFYTIYGHERCILRHPHYADFLKLWSNPIIY